MMRKATRSYSKLLLLVVTVSVLFVADAVGSARHRQKPQNEERARVGGTAGLTQLQNKVKAQMSLISARKSQTGKQDLPTLQSLLERINQMQDQLQPVYFNAFKDTGYDKPRTAIPYTGTALNVGGGMNAETGIFTAPKDGNYFFIFNALANKGIDSATAVGLLLNGINVLSRAYVRGLPSDEKNVLIDGTLAMQTTVNLRKGDTVKVDLLSGTILDNSDRFTQFTGFLLMPEAPTRKPEAPRKKFSYLKSKYGKCLTSAQKDVNWMGADYKAAPGHFKCEDQPFMRWTYNSSGDLHICNSANKCVSVESGWYFALQLNHRDEKSQQFTFEAVPSFPGYFLVKSKDGKCLTIDGEDDFHVARSMNCIDKAPFNDGQLWKWE